MRIDAPIYTLDIETDPFKHGRYPLPFAICVYDGESCKRFWGQDCISKMHEYLMCREPGIIYAHNGGRFDIFYIIKWVLGNEMRIINSRIIKALMRCHFGHHEIRDSYAIMPFALGKYKGKTQKKKIEMWKFEADKREEHKAEILEYLDADCMALHELCVAFIAMFGTQLTIGSTAMKELRKIHTFENLDPSQDFDFRSKYFYGGRVECFQKGVLKGDWKVFDVNSMYPFVMANCQHPIGPPSSEGSRIKATTQFITATGTNHGAFPMRTKGGGIRFDVEYGTFHVTRHEWDMAEKYGLFEVESVDRCINFEDTGNFAEFVDSFYSQRKQAILDGDEIKSLFYKFILNSAYGKFAQNPENYKEQIITDYETDMRGMGWLCSELIEAPGEDRYIVWSKKSEDTSRYNVAAGASITGAARAKLMEAIATAVRPVYCDTDCVICENLPIADVDASRLGAWKLEATADVAAIAGKKLYALFEKDAKVKQANKGVQITARDILDVCMGKVVQSVRDAPSFKLDGSYSYISRKVRMT